MITCQPQIAKIYRYFFQTWRHCRKWFDETLYHTRVNQLNIDFDTGSNILVNDLPKDQPMKIPPVEPYYRRDVRMISI